MRKVLYAGLAAVAFVVGVQLGIKTGREQTIKEIQEQARQQQAEGDVDAPEEVEDDWSGG